MATKKDLVEAHAFSRRRLVTAFVSGAPGGREVEPVRPGRVLIGGVALSVLLLARTDSGAVALERLPLDLGDVASDAASVLARTADGRGVSIRVDPEPAMLEGDPARLRQLVTILVDNAIRHSPRGGAQTRPRGRRARPRSAGPSGRSRRSDP